MFERLGDMKDKNYQYWISGNENFNVWDGKFYV